MTLNIRDAPLQIDANQQIAVTITALEWQLVLRALGKMPFEEVAGLIPAIAQQVRIAGAMASQREPSREDIAAVPLPVGGGHV